MRAGSNFKFGTRAEKGWNAWGARQKATERACDTYVADFPPVLPAAPPSAQQPRLPPHHKGKRDGREREARAPSEHAT